jgi:broad specificity phosphatase PhoE
MKNMLIHLMRHGQFDADEGHRTDGYVDPQLSALGIEQAKALAGRLHRHHPIDALYTSDLRRTIQTATIVAQALGIEPRIEPRFREIYRGVLEEKSWEQIEREYPDFYREWIKREIDVPYPNGESGREVWLRAGTALDEITQSHNGDIGIITHGGTIMILLSGCLGLDMAKRRGFRIDTCSLTTIEFDQFAHRFTVVRVNDTSHLV